VAGARKRVERNRIGSGGRLRVPRIVGLLAAAAAAVLLLVAGVV